MKAILPILLTLLIIQNNFAQSRWADSLQVEAGLQLQLAQQDYMPLWLVANRFGTVSDRGSDLQLSFSAKNSHSLATIKDKPLQFDYGVSLYANQYFDQLFAQQAYLALGYGQWEVFAGRKELRIGELDHELSSGSYAVSGNALPHPRLGIRTRDFVPVPFTFRWLQFKFLTTHGWLGQDRYVGGAFAHEKTLLLRAGRNQWFVHGGVHHMAVWGGEHPVFGAFPDGFPGFWRAFMVFKGLESVHDSDILNKQGNHIGIFDFGLTIRFAESEIAAYTQTLFEDRSGFQPITNPDRRTGIRWNKEGPSLLNGFTLEYMNTTFQSGSTYPPGLDNYYNHALYSTGWEYRQQVIGIPLFINRSRGEKIFGEDSAVLSDSWNMVSNRIQSWHMGLKGYFGEKLSYRALLTRTDNWGAYHNRRYFERGVQWNSMLEIEYTLNKNWQFDFTLALDQGVLGNNAGLLLGTTYRMQK